MQLKKAEWCEPGAGTFLPSYSKNTATDRNEQSEMGTELVCKTRNILDGATCPSVFVHVRPVNEMHPIVDSGTNEARKPQYIVLTMVYETIYRAFKHKQPEKKTF